MAVDGDQSKDADNVFPCERARVKGRAHPLEPVCASATPALTAELVAGTDRVIEVGIAAADREERVALGDAVVDRLDAHAVHRVGKILILWCPGGR